MSQPPGGWGGYDTESWASQRTFSTFADVVALPTRFVERPLLQEATFHLLAGRMGVGKGALCVRWIAHCTTGALFGEPQPVLWLASEEDPERDLRPRLDVAGADAKLVVPIPNSFLLPRDIEALRDDAIRNEIKLIILDPLSNHIGRASSNVDEEVRNALQPLAILAGEIGAVIVGIRHITSKDATRGVLASILGSTAWPAVPRVVLGAVKDEQGRLHVRVVKGNRVPEAEAGLRFLLAPMQYGLDSDYPEGVVRAVEDGASDADLDELLLAKRGRGVTQRARVEIVRALREAGGSMPSDQLDSLIALRIGMAARTVKNARMQLREWGWLSAHPERHDDRITAWHVSLTNAAPLDADLDEAVADPLTFASRAHARAQGDTPREDSSSFLIEPAEDLSLFGSSGPTGHPDVTGPLVPSSPPDPPPLVDLVCPRCSSYDVGVFTGRCHACGLKVNEPTSWEDP